MTYVEEVFEHRRWDWITSERAAQAADPADQPDAQGDLGAERQRASRDPEA